MSESSESPLQGLKPVTAEQVRELKNSRVYEAFLNLPIMVNEPESFMHGDQVAFVYAKQRRSIRYLLDVWDLESDDPTPPEIVQVLRYLLRMMYYLDGDAHARADV